MPTAGLKRRDVVPTATERAELIRRLVALGYRATDLASVVRAGVTRQGIATALAEMQRGAARA